jgi:hypothetical protein
MHFDLQVRFLHSNRQQHCSADVPIDFYRFSGTVSEYSSESGLKSLPSAAEDVQAMQRTLLQSSEFSAENITVLTNPQKDEVDNAIYWLFADRQKEDLLLFYFSGHGIKDETGKLYFSLPTTRKNQNGSLIKHTAVPATVLHDNMNDSRSTCQLLVLDCCFSAAFAKGLTIKDDGSVDVRTQLGGKGRAIFTSSNSTEYSFHHEDFKLSVYTHFFVEGLETGAADLDSDGLISVDELHTYVSDKVKQVELKMTPQFFPVEQGHKIHLARSARNAPEKDTLSWTVKLTKENFLAVYDVILDIQQELQFQGIIQIPLLPTIVRFQMLMPVDSIKMRDRYCDLRWKSINLIKKQGVIIDCKLLQEAHRWRSRLQIDLDSDAFTLFVEEMGAEYRNRFDKNTNQQELNSKERGTPEKLESAPIVEDDLSSERFGANYYVQLRDLLKAGKWKEADRETAARMCEVMDRQEDGWLSKEDIQFFPHQDLKNINQLWVNYSDGKFGFSVQKKIYLECGAKLDGKYPGDDIWSNFANQIGWGIGLNKGDYFNTRWTGHLPTLLFWVDLWMGSWGLNKDLLILLLSRGDL